MHATAKGSVRKAEYAGKLYPADQKELAAAVDVYTGSAQIRYSDIDKMKTLIVPIGGYLDVGPSLGYAYKHLEHSEGLQQ